MRTVVVFGAGAVGSLFGARLAAAGCRVVLVGRPEHVAAIRADGLTVEGLGAGTFRLAAFSSLAPGTAADAALLTVKSFDLATASRKLAAAMVKPVPTALLANGLGIEEIAQGGLRDGGWERPETVLVRAIHSVPATLLGPGRVRASGTGEVIFPEPGSGGARTEAVEALVRLFSENGFSVRTSPAFDLEVWRKAVVNAAINPVTAIRRVPNGALLGGPAREEAELLLSEAVDVARRSGVDLTLESARVDLDRIVRSTAENRSSMLQDVERGRPTEIDTISGEILRRGRRLGLELVATLHAVDEVHRALAGAHHTAQP